MSVRAFTYVWKIPRPQDELVAQQLMAAAYQTAMATDPHATTVLIRSQIHATTTRNGHYVRDAPHITICSKNPQQAEQHNHQAAHGYTKTTQDLHVISVSPSKVTKPDSTKDTKGKEIWPNGLPSEAINHTE